MRSPVQLKRVKGTLKKREVFYTGKAIVLDTPHGEIMIMADTLGALIANTVLITPPGFVPDVSRVQEVALCHAAAVSVDDV